MFLKKDKSSKENSQNFCKNKINSIMDIKKNGDLTKSSTKKSLVSKIDSPVFQNVPAIVIVDIDEVSQHDNDNDNETEERRSYHEDQVDAFIDE